jgi:hypothetical protein
MKRILAVLTAALLLPPSPTRAQEEPVEPVLSFLLVLLGALVACLTALGRAPPTGCAPNPPRSSHSR